MQSKIILKRLKAFISGIYFAKLFVLALEKRVYLKGKIPITQC
jgi:hypothetical protein